MSTSASTGEHKLVVVSSPTNGPNPATGHFDFPVMQRLKLDMAEGKLTIGYSFAGDSIPFIDTKRLQDAYSQAKPDEKADALAALAKAVKGGPWWGPYTGQVMGNVKALCQQGHSVTMVGIQGGPITQLEQIEMASIKMNIEADLRSAKLGLNPVIELDLGLASYPRFAEKYKLHARNADASSTKRELEQISAKLELQPLKDAPEGGGSTVPATRCQIWPRLLA